MRLFAYAPRIGASLALSCLLQVLSWSQSHDAPRPLLITNVHLAGRAEAAHLLLRDGRIQALLPLEAELPTDVWRIEGEGLLALPAFLDAGATALVDTPQPLRDQDRKPDLQAEVWTDMRSALRSGIAPAFHASTELLAELPDTEAWEKLGFGAILAAPTGELLAGTSAWIAARPGPVRERVILSDVAQHASFRTRGGGYPESQMGAIAQLRQFFLDARQQRELERRFAQGRPGPRPPCDAQLAAAYPLFDGEMPLVFAAERASEIETWLALCAEFDLRPVVFGGREAWRLTERLAEQHAAVLLTLDWGKEPAKPAEPKAATQAQAGEAAEAQPDADTKPQETGKQDDAAQHKRPLYREPEALVVERHRLWTEARDCALRLETAGVLYAFVSGTAGAKELLQHTRQLIDAGLDPAAAQLALSVRPAQILGLSARLGSIAPGYDADLALWTHDPLDRDPKVAKKAQLAWLVVDGFARDFKLEEQSFEEQPPDQGVDLSGKWLLTFEPVGGAGPAEARVEFTMKTDGELSGKAELANPVGEGQLRFELEGHVGGSRLRCAGSFELEGEQHQLEIELALHDEVLEGTLVVTWPAGQQRSPLTATRLPGSQEQRQ